MFLNKELYGKMEFAKIINKSPKTINTLERLGIIEKGQRNGKYVFYTRDDVLKALKHLKSVEIEESIKSDIIMIKDLNLMEYLSKNYELMNIKIVENFDFAKEHIELINRVFIEKGFLNKEDYDFIIKVLNFFEIEVIELDNEKTV